MAEGLSGGDFSCAQVIILASPYEQIAVWHGHVDADLFGVYLARLARYYNNARIILEINGHGLTTLTTLTKGSPGHQMLPYKHLYNRVVFDESGKKTTKEGWKTTRPSKLLLIDDLKAAIRQGDIIIHDKKTLDELANVVQFEDGSIGAPHGCFDDRVIALALTIQASKTMSIMTSEEESYESEPVGCKVSGF